eukprot:m.247052 g.247052  ORF g.247052 m.247052 type:complete len:102 (+) comp10968_c3_seq37:2039-2344(+)
MHHLYLSSGSLCRQILASLATQPKATVAMPLRATAASRHFISYASGLPASLWRPCLLQLFPLVYRSVYVLRHISLALGHVHAVFGGLLVVGEVAYNFPPLS